ncbi:ChuX/HutX family heme-like substrate-binding protein [Mucilaginibacter sabulilitoris]|uniref:ChuX/HutX family heme-like substrate-binding protein n=1 Tax=Mucilaginibacter sabulilitoris TaxID=1173583 RepID=A0ABZ0TIT0_9SPHI|nr:ChuX/HutX family heme-like substrate-binding protein [Mucilaginibacter sabulilitoris]WPU91490.1 ChuX/HutX family heme-like substrate-binding protein [Mucilaginibacter sabulilitoris]
METISLKEQYLAFKAQNPKKRIRDIATALQVSEAELLMTSLGENTVILNDTFEDILKEIPSLGYVMALTRNEYCVHERKGIYTKVSFTPHAGLVLGADIDLRLFMNQWKLGFAVEDNGHKSLQFFDCNGVAIHKIYLTEKSNIENYNGLVNRFRKTEQKTVMVLPAEAPAKFEKSDDEIDLPAFHQAWETMQDTHEFFGLLKRFGLSRTQALRLAPKGFAKQTDINSFKKVMQSCSAQQIPVMVFVGNNGCIQIHTGTVTRLVEMEIWFNVLDPEFNLHLRQDAIATIWHVAKPSADGDINSLELYDKNGEMIMQLFGKRKPGLPELNEWRKILAENL